MIQFEEDYFEIIEEIMTFGNSTAFKNNGNFNIFSVELNVDMLKEGFPLMKSHKLDIKNIIVDVLGNIRGINNNKWFRENGCNRYIRYGLPFKEVKQVPKEDHELTDEYCSNKGEYGPTSQEYLMRFAKLKSISSKEGLALIDKDDITFWKDVVLKERGDLGVTRGLLWRKYPGINNEKIDQLRNAFEHLSSDNNYKSFTVHSQCPFLLPDPKKSLNENIALGRMGGLTSHVSHQYYTSSISTLDRVEIYNKRSKNKIKVKHDNIKEVDKHLNKLNIPKYYLSLSFQQTNWDFISDAPNDIAGYGVLLTMMASMLNMIPKNVEAKGTNVYIRKNHMDIVTELFNRVSRNGVSKSKSKLHLDKRSDVSFIDEFTYEDFTLFNYDPMPEIKLPTIKIF